MSKIENPKLSSSEDLLAYLDKVYFNRATVNKFLKRRDVKRKHGTRTFDDLRGFLKTSVAKRSFQREWNVGASGKEAGSSFEVKVFETTTHALSLLANQAYLYKRVGSAQDIPRGASAEDVDTIFHSSQILAQYFTEKYGSFTSNI